ncbi:MAG TPA: alpha/beta hydrolase [Candidatus Kapabacteria bacterium]|nr:alpha/beta hydrolase [Candidatus Kapabacteria bacterium]
MRYLALCFLILSGCMRLDGNLLSPGDEISQYLLDDYQGEVDFRTPEEMKVSNFTFVDLTSGGNTIKAIYLGDTSRIKTDTVIVYCHGYNHHIDFYWPRVSLLAQTGGKHRFGVMILDYRGFGLSEGETTEESMYEDVNEAINWLKLKGLTQERLALYGFSLGGMPAVELAHAARAMRAQWLITESAYASPELLAQDATHLAIPGSFFTNVKGDNAEKIKKVDQPYLNIHGDVDQFIKFETHALEIRGNYQGQHLEAVTVRGADHEDVPEVMGFEIYLRTIEDFLTKN